MSNLEYMKRFQAAFEGTTLCCEGNRVSQYEMIMGKLVEIFSQQKEKNKNRTYFIGNGGSAAIAIHMTADFLKNAGITTVGMHDAATITCLGNDYKYEYVFSKQLEMHAKPGDLLVAISSSGNSANIIHAINMAHEKGAQVLTITGFKENNQAKQLGEYNLYVPSMEYGIVESIHNMILQQVVDTL